MVNTIQLNFDRVECMHSIIYGLFLLEHQIDSINQRGY